MDTGRDASSTLLDKERLVYHRGHVVYALSQADRTFRHVLDVPNGSACGCICDICSAPLVAKANLPEEVFLRECHFAHAPGTKCNSTGERGLIEAVRHTLSQTQSFRLPAIFWKQRPHSKAIKVHDSILVQVDDITFLEVVGRSVPDLLIQADGQTVRLHVTTKLKSDHGFASLAEKDGTNSVWWCVRPDSDGRIFIRDILFQMASAQNSHWIFHKESYDLYKLWRDAHVVESAAETTTDFSSAVGPSLQRPQIPRKDTGTFLCFNCRQKNAQFVPDSPGNRWGKCGTCGVVCCPTVLN
jgi:hypothetical protein